MLLDTTSQSWTWLPEYEYVDFPTAQLVHTDPFFAPVAALNFPAPQSVQGEPATALYFPGPHAEQRALPGADDSPAPQVLQADSFFAPGEGLYFPAGHRLQGE